MSSEIILNWPTGDPPLSTTVFAQFFLATRPESPLYFSLEFLCPSIPSVALNLNWIGSTQIIDPTHDLDLLSFGGVERYKIVAIKLLLLRRREWKNELILSSKRLIQLHGSFVCHLLHFHAQHPLVQSKLGEEKEKRRQPLYLSCHRIRSQKTKKEEKKRSFVWYQNYRNLGFILQFIFVDYYSLHGVSLSPLHLRQILSLHYVLELWLRVVLRATGCMYSAWMTRQWIYMDI